MKALPCRSAAVETARPEFANHSACIARCENVRVQDVLDELAVSPHLVTGDGNPDEQLLEIQTQRAPEDHHFNHQVF